MILRCLKKLINFLEKRKDSEPAVLEIISTVADNILGCKGTVGTVRSQRYWLSAALALSIWFLHVLIDRASMFFTLSAKLTNLQFITNLIELVTSFRFFRTDRKYFSRKIFKTTIAGLQWWVSVLSY